MNLQPLLINSPGADPDGDVRAELEVAQELTRFHRATMSRRRRAIGQFINDAKAMRVAAELNPPNAIDRINFLPDVPMPKARLSSVLEKRRSVRRDSLAGTLSEQKLSALLGLALRVNGELTAPICGDAVFGLRPYASAGALYPCENYVLRSLSPPQRYDSKRHSLIDYGMPSADFRTVEIGSHDAAPACAIAITGIFERAMKKYGGRGYRFTVLEAGHASQNLLLAAEATGLPALAYGSYYDDELERLLGVDGKDEAVLAVVLIGATKTDGGADG